MSDDYVGALLAWSASGGARVAVLAYEHDLPPGEPRRTAAALYELRLRYVEAMLRAIPTIYAFSTIGSTIVCTPEGYAAAGGMNTRKATEDFYFLQSAAKAGGVERLERPIVYPSARLSDRVYLGTGHGIGKIVEASLEMRLEHPDTYAVAGRALQAVLDAFDREPELPAEFARFLSEKGMERLLRSARDGARTPDAFRRRVHEWFDALVIRQAVHFLRDNVYGELPWRDALDRAGLADLARRVPRG
ncbi:MAG: hypothetical protein M5R36_20000 [Deltaproteobacteria bacterium]|nr:hypothetical protein [Deltaproteobacteria bacterium]